MRWIVCAAVLVSGCQTAPATAPLAAQQLPPNALAAAERSRAPGLVAAIIRDGRVERAYAWGGAACDGSGSADIADAYEIGSISKHITAVALLQLWERDRVDLDAPVGRYLTDIPEAWRIATLRQLLTHTGGVPDYEEAGGYGIYETTPTPAQVYAIVADRPLDFEPGARWSYSNTGYFLLSLVVQRVSGERFGDYLREHLFEPLGMHHTFMGGYAPSDATLAQGCKPGEPEGAPRITVPPISEASTFGAGGISSTLADWALWDEALHNGRILSSRAMEVLFATQHLSDGSDTGYAFGMIRDALRGAPRLSHSGQTQGFTADYARYPERDFSIVVFGNSYGSGVGGVARALALREMPELSYDRLPVPTDPDPQRTANTRRALRQAAVGQEPIDLLGGGMRGLALDPQGAPSRAILRPHAEHADELVYLRSDPPDQGYERHIYKSMIDGETWYLAFTWYEGLLVGVRREDE
jgi:D-alanyl-D-alanine carboxypeptidase